MCALPFTIWLHVYYSFTICNSLNDLQNSINNLCVVCALPKILYINLWGRWKYDIFYRNVSSHNGVPWDLRIHFARLFTFITLKKRKKASPEGARLINSAFSYVQPNSRVICPVLEISPSSLLNEGLCLILYKCCDWLSLLHSSERTIKNEKGREFRCLLLSWPHADLLIF